MEKKYTINFNNRDYGPFDDDELIKLLKNGFVPSYAKIKYYDEDFKPIQLDKNFNKYFESEKKIHKIIQKEEEKKDALIDEDFGIEVIKKDDKDKKSDNEYKVIEKDKDKTVVIKKNELIKYDDIVKEQGKETNQTELNEKKIKKKTPLIMYIAVLLVVLLLMYDEEEKVERKTEVLYPEISIPITENINLSEADDLFVEGKVLIEKKTFLNFLNASKKFRKSFEKNVENYQPLLFLNYTYSYLLAYSRNLKKDAIKLNQLFKLARQNNILNNTMTLLSKVQFYININKFETAKYLIEKHLNINKKANSELLNLYLITLIKTNDVKKLNKLYNKIIKLKNIDLLMYKSLFDYLLKFQKMEKYSQLFERLKKYKPQEFEKLDYYLIMARNFYLSEQKLKLQEFLLKVENGNFLFNKKNYSQFNQLKGILFTLKNKPEDASAFFKKALEYDEDTDLYHKLSTLDLTKNKLFDRLILSSKINVLRSSCRKNMEEKNWNAALTDIIQAVDYDPTNIESVLLLSEVQMRRGHFDQALLNLEELYKKHSLNKKVVVALLRAYTKVFKFDKVENLTRKIVTEEYKYDDEYTKAMSEYYYYKKEKIKSILWLHRSVKINPLNDKNLYKLAQIYLENNQFDKAQKIINRAIVLDPSKIHYRILYSNIIYEKEGVDVAVGYLRSLIKDFSDHASIHNQIAIFYYRSGQIKNYKDLRSKLKSLNEEQKKLITYLIKVARLDGNVKDVIKFTEELIKKDPSDLSSMIKLTEILIEEKKYDTALDVLKDVYTKMKTYPKVQYFRSMLYFELADTDKAIEFAKMEIANNPYYEDGYNLLGEILISKKEYAEAEKYYKEAQKINNKSLRALKGLAFVKLRRNLHEPALDLYRKALKLYPNDSELYFHMGEVYRYLGMTKDSIESYKTFLKLEPNSKFKDKVEKIIRAYE